MDATQAVAGAARRSPGGGAGVLLLSCYELGHQPLALAWPLAFLREAGIEARAVDLAVEPFPVAQARAARLVAISVPMHTALRLGVQAARRARELNPRAYVVLYGHYAWLNAPALGSVADAFLAGEMEGRLVELAKAVLAGRPPAPAREAARERLRLPAPDRSGLLPLSRYARFVSGGSSVPAGYTEASRGCKHLCRHCPVVPVYGGRFLAVPVETVMADVRAQAAAGARHITFGDPDFLNGPTHALRVARALHQELPALSFDCTAKVEHLLLHRALLPELRALGCAFVVSAVESLSDRVLQRLRKGHTAGDVALAVDALEAAGIALHPTLVAFTPWTTLDDYVLTLEFFRERSLASHVPPVQLSIRLLAPPGSALLADPETAAAFGPLDPTLFGHGWRHPDPRMDALHEAVAARVAADEEARRPGRETWEAVRALAYRALGRVPPHGPLRASFEPDPPRLTEHWFC